MASGCGIVFGAPCSMILKAGILRAGLALGLLLLAVLTFLPGVASAHAGHDPETVIFQTTEDPAHEAEGHPGHCHGGSFCSGLAVVVPSANASALIGRETKITASLPPVPSVHFLGLDPPPPKLMF